MFIVTRLSVVFLLSSLCIRYVESVQCSQCFNYNGQVCVSAGDCNANHCLYEEIQQSNGLVTVRKTCMTQDYYQFDDGFVLYANAADNQCFTRTTRLGQYHIRICDDSNNCNNQCYNMYLSTTTTLPPTVNTFPPVLGNQVSCYECVSTDGTDCRSGSCTGNYCLYERQLVGNRLIVKKSCLIEPVFALNDGTLVETVDVCEVRNTADSTYYIKICRDVNMCNGYCNPGTVDPLRQPVVTCYNCESNTGDCFSGSCRGAYCLYEKQTRPSTGAIYVRKGCSSSPYVEYPDLSMSKSINSCERRLINDVNYELNVCNNGNNCNAGCDSNSQTITCTSCVSSNQNDCQGTTCTGQYCIFEKQTSVSTGQMQVKKSCSNTPVIAYPDNTIYSGTGHCQARQINGINYLVKVCNSSSFCNTACADTGFSTTYAPILINSSGYSITIVVSLVVLLLLTM